MGILESESPHQHCDLSCHRHHQEHHKNRCLSLRYHHHHHQTCILPSLCNLITLPVIWWHALSACHPSPLSQPRTNGLHQLNASSLTASSHPVDPWIHTVLVSPEPETVRHSVFEGGAQNDANTPLITLAVAAQLARLSSACSTKIALLFWSPTRRLERWLHLHLHSGCSSLREFL